MNSLQDRDCFIQAYFSYKPISLENSAHFNDTTDNEANPSMSFQCVIKDKEISVVKYRTHTHRTHTPRLLVVKLPICLNTSDFHHPPDKSRWQEKPFGTSREDLAQFPRT